jgi:polar amino acid transport system substrate-binding protein
VELTGGIIVGQLPLEGGTGDLFGLVLAKDSPLTERVSAAVDALRENGTLAAIEAEWLSDSVSVPVLK